MKAQPNSIESKFDLDELFFSKTNLHGIIESFNEVFVRVSEFSSEELKNKPHSIIRHPDMPRSVFKLLWSEISSGRPLCAYVKNMTKTGKYYWVFAMAFPIEGGYLSIRLKPTTPLLATVEKLYKDMLSTEKSISNQNESMQASTELLIKTLKKLGFNSYQEFMQTSLAEELAHRDSLLKNQNRTLNVTDSPDASSRSFKLLFTCYEHASNMFTSIFHFEESLKYFDEVANKIKLTGFDVNLFTTNLSISADKLGQAGQVLSVVSSGFGKMAAEIKEGIFVLINSLENLKVEQKNMKFLAAISKFQVEMLFFFIKELQKKDSNESSENSLNKNNEFKRNSLLLKNLIEENLLNIESQITNFKNTFFNVNKSIDDFTSIITGMDVIKISGKIEISRITDTENSLNNHVETMARLNDVFKSSLEKLSIESQKSIAQFNAITTTSYEISKDMARFSTLIS